MNLNVHTQCTCYKRLCPDLSFMINKKQKGKKLKDKIISLIGLWFIFRKKLKVETWYLKENSYNKNSNIRFLTLAELLQTKSYLKLIILLKFVHRWLFCIYFIYLRNRHDSLRFLTKICHAYRVNGEAEHNSLTLMINHFRKFLTVIITTKRIMGSC